MTRPKTGECRSCKARITFATTQNGKTQILDREPSARGNVLLMVPLASQRSEAFVLAIALNGDALEDARQDQQLFTSHFVSCPHSEQWRK